MSVGSFPLRLPEELKNIAMEQAAEAGVSLNQYISVALALRVGAQAEAERYFATRAARSSRGRARQILEKAGTLATPDANDRLDAADEED
jgi:hypothetical protein